MKNLLLILALFVVSCSFERDTRLVCDCDYVVKDLQKYVCYSTSHNLDNNSLVFNVSKKKFVWNSIDITFSADQFMEFNEDNISYMFNTETSKTYKNLDRTNLVYSESKQMFDKFFNTDDGKKIPTWKPVETSFYQCRVVEGV